MAEYPALDLRFQPGAEEDRVEAGLYAVLDDFHPIAIHERDAGDGWLVFFRNPGSRDDAGGALATAIGTLLLSCAAVEVPDDDWARRSQADLTAITVGRITVAPPWGVPAPAPAGTAKSRVRTDSAILIVIEPSMGFGTGHHQTTRLCLTLLQRVRVRGHRVVDVGTGSGVLALAAWALGAGPVLAMDHDPDAVQNARENIERNGASGAIELTCADLSAFIAPPADLATANLTAGLLVQQVVPLRRLVAPGGTLIASGFSPADLRDVLGAFGAAPDVEHVIEDDWAAAVIPL